VRLVYRLGAPHYDAVRAATEPAANAALLPLLAQILARYPHPALLDVATGTGRVPHLLRVHPAFNGTLAGLDRTPAMLVAARRKERTLRGTPVAWVLGDGDALPWPAARFDIASCLEALEYMPRPRHALAEIVRVLRPGGTLLVSCWADGWARLLPGRALSARAMLRELSALGCVDLAVHPWQHGHYQLVVGRKGQPTRC
jgi:ubiquinone/menaquinone biosynthesis C-methylase UbiE